ncbi:MAG: nuclear transport factor 2 family protein [Myxococcota bacterium]|nr:nuclear transport factor 2 family protein [Myxococcota bacterium]
MEPVESLARRQLDAYNAADLDAFCACYHPQVRVLDHDGNEVCVGIEAFRRRYEALFSTRTFGGAVETRLVVGEHCVDHERWWRTDPATGERSEGEVLVRYRLRDGSIGEAQFFR